MGHQAHSRAHYGTVQSSVKRNGMHWTTYNRPLDEADEANDRGWSSALGGLLCSAG
ncbi:MAG: hypothetical protein ACJZ7Z_09600 [Myxococcota bacterium]